MYDIQEIRKDFPILGREVYGRPLVYLDNGATTQKPRCVVEAMTDEYYNVNANVHRGVHFLSQQATELHEAARETVRRFLNARSPAEIVFTRGTTESINLVASCFGEAFMREGDEVILSEMEHHSNIVSWQLLQARRGIKLRVVPINDRGELMLDEYERLFNDRTRIVSVTHVSNVLGTVNPVRRMIGIAHAHGVPVLVDGAQSTPHFAVDMQSLDADFFAFSGHKIYGPTGVGVLYGKETWLDRLPPYMGGGEMIRHVTFGHTTFNGLPFKFEAGTPDYVATTGLARALDYVAALGMDSIHAHEQELARYALERMRRIPGMRILGEAGERDAVISFLVGGIHHLDMGTLLDRLGIAVYHKPHNTTLELHGVRLALDCNRVWVDEREVDLTETEYKILRLLMQNPQRIFSIQVIYETVWNEPYYYVSNGTVMVHIRNLRMKVEDDPQKPTRICTVWGKGYRFVSGEEGGL